MSTKTLTTWTIGVVALASAGPLPAHHSLAQFDLTTPIWLQGIVVGFERINPHSIVIVERVQDDGQVQRWSVAGPDVRQLDRRRIGQDFLQAGDVVEFCGFALKESVASQRPSSSGSLAGQIMNGHLLVMPDGQKHFWSDYGQLHKCVDADELESLIRSRAQPVGVIE